MHRMTIHYAVPDDPEGFLQRYRDEHVDLVTPVPGLRRFAWSRPRSVGEPAGDVFLIAQLDFEDQDALKAALGSAEMAAAGAHADELGVPRTTYLGEVVTAYDA